ncbi:hypothetical protein QYE76_033918 [Lolium multiflorum]|uniref:RNase H type-1 domain-containing protein n=1 Tax=Lolium multiflorum TaxID=4521 RepID=A0AAD8QW56_LOLMU|nr:hypothetical protein QYE76_033918 [Lolium multiflorum]
MAAPASTSQPPGAESVRVYALHDSRWEFIADLGLSDGSHHAAAEAPEQATAQAEGEAKVLLVFCNKGSISGIAYLLPDAPRQSREDDEEEDEDEDDDGEVDEVDGEVGEDDDDVEDEHQHASTRTATDESSSNGSSANKENKHGTKEDADWGYWEDNTVDKTKFYGLVVQDDDGEEDASTETATDESSSNGSSADKDNKHGAKGDVDKDEEDDEDGKENEDGEVGEDEDEVGEENEDVEVDEDEHVKRVAVHLSGFEFGVTIYPGMSWDRLRQPQRFTSIVEGQEPHHVLLRVSSGAIGLWPAEVMFDGEGQMFLHNGALPAHTTLRPDTLSSSKRTMRLIAPSQGRVKVNVDAAVAKTSTKGAVGAVCRSFEGLYLGASATVYEGVTSPGILEALACREGLDVADDLGVDAIQVASDCLDVLKGLQGVNLGEYGSILMEIQARASSRGDTAFGHERREHNVEAHNLARFASSLPEGRYVWFLEPPSDIPINVTRDI